MRYLYSLVILNSTTIKIKKIIHKKEKLSISRSGVTTSGRSCAALSMKSCRWQGARQDQESALLPHPPGAEIWTAKVLLAGMREGTAQSLASITLNNSYKYRPHVLLTHS